MNTYTVLVRIRLLGSDLSVELFRNKLKNLVGPSAAVTPLVAVALQQLLLADRLSSALVNGHVTLEGAAHRERPTRRAASLILDFCHDAMFPPIKVLRKVM